MHRVWTVVLSVWAMLAIVAALAWTHRPVPLASQAPPQTVVVKGANGKKQVLLVQPAAPHATTSTSAVIR